MIEIEKTKDLRGRSKQELAERAAELRKTLFDRQFQHGTRQLTDTAQLRTARREIAKTLTILKEKEREEQQA